MYTFAYTEDFWGFLLINFSFSFSLPHSLSRSYSFFRSRGMSSELVKLDNFKCVSHRPICIGYLIIIVSVLLCLLLLWLTEREEFSVWAFLGEYFIKFRNYPSFFSIHILIVVADEGNGIQFRCSKILKWKWCVCVYFRI